MDREMREQLSRTEAKVGDGPYDGIVGWKRRFHGNSFALKIGGTTCMERSARFTQAISALVHFHAERAQHAPEEVVRANQGLRL